VRRADLITAALFVVLGVVTLFAGIPRDVAGDAAEGDLSPAFMPYVAACLATGAMLLLFVTRLLDRRTDSGDAPLPPRAWVFLGLCTAVLVASFALMEAFGYLPGAALLVAGFLLIVRADIRVALGAAAALSFALWLLFDRALDFPLP
jgi:hypothetical protein